MKHTERSFSIECCAAEPPGRRHPHPKVSCQLCLRYVQRHLLPAAVNTCLDLSRQSRLPGCCSSISEQGRLRLAAQVYPSRDSSIEGKGAYQVLGLNSDAGVQVWLVCCFTVSRRARHGRCGISTVDAPCFNSVLYRAPLSVHPLHYVCNIGLPCATVLQQEKPGT